MAALRRFGLLLTLSICIACSIADRNSDVFSKPPGSAYGNFALNAVYQADQDVEFAWSYDTRPIDLLLARVDLSNMSATPRQWVLQSAILTQTYTWTPDGREKYLNNPDDSGLDTVFVASLSFVGADTSIWRTASHYFNVTRAAPDSSSTPSQVDEFSKSGPSAATIAGIAISAVLIFLVVLGTILLLLWRRSRRAKPPHRLPSQTSSMRDVLRAPKSMEEAAAAKASSSSSSSSSRGSCNEERHAELHGQNSVIAELPGSCWTDFTPELPGVWRIRRSGDSWEPDAPERLDVRRCNAAQRRDLVQPNGKTDLEKEDDEDKDKGTEEDTGRPATPPPEYATCGSHTLEPFMFNLLEYQLPAKEQHTDSNT
ncbi:hypothetical protein MY11210_009374 [Beauveria gryllotalpidicola]